MRVCVLGAVSAQCAINKSMDRRNDFYVHLYSRTTQKFGQSVLGDTDLSISHMNLEIAFGQFWSKVTINER